VTLPGLSPDNPRGLLAVVRGDLPPDLFRRFRAARLVAWDIETSGLDWRDCKIGTCQLYADQIGAVIISAITGETPERLISLLEEPDVVKVFHHAPFDLRFMMNEWNAGPVNIRCTKVASKIIAPTVPNENHSLQSLLSEYLNVHLQKGAVRTSDWSASQLSEEQLEYAVADVTYLPSLLSILCTRLDALGLNQIYDDCCKFLPTRARLELGGYPDVFAY
jgi:ribonuclease D